MLSKIIIMIIIILTIIIIIIIIWHKQVPLALLAVSNEIFLYNQNK